VHRQPVSFEPYAFHDLFQKTFVVEAGDLIKPQRLFPLNLRYVTPNSFPQDISFFVLAFVGRKQLRHFNEESFEIIFSFLDDIFKELIVNISIDKPEAVENCSNFLKRSLTIVEVESYFLNDILHFEVFEAIVLLDIHVEYLLSFNQIFVLDQLYLFK
jgi:hypothetical protein